MRFSRCLVVAAVIALLPRVASATPTFPEDIKSHLAAASAPACSVCHAGEQKRGTVTTPFGTAMRSRGLVAYDTNSLNTALDALGGEKRDSDNDGISDVDELKAGTNPNAAGQGGDDVPVPDYGCNVGRPARANAAFEGLLIGLAAILFVRRRVQKT